MGETTMKMNPQFKKRGVALIVMVFFSFMLMAFMSNDSVNLLSTALPELRGYMQTQITLPVTIGGWLAIPVVIICGTLVKKIGSFNLLKFSYGLFFVAMLLLALVEAYPAYFAGILCTRVAQGMAMFGAFQACNDWFYDFRGRALGIVTIGCPVSSAALIPLLNKGIDSLGFKGSWIVLAVLALVMCIVWCLMGKSTPEAYGWQPDGYNRSEEQVLAMGMADVTPLVWTVKRMMQKKEFWIVLIIAATSGMVNGGGLMQFIPVSLSAGIPEGTTMLIWSLCNVIAIPTSYIAGVIDDKIGTRMAYKIVIAFTFIMPFSFVLLISTGNVFFLGLAGFCVGVLAGCLLNLNPSMKTHVFGRRAFTDFNRVGQSVDCVFQALSVTVLALFYDITGSYKGGFMFFGILMVIMFALTFTIKSHAPEEIGMEEAKKSAGITE